MGNVYRNELCFLRGVLPTRPVAEVPDLPRMVDLAKRMLEANRNRVERTLTGDTRRGKQDWVYGRDRTTVPALRHADPRRAARRSGAAGAGQHGSGDLLVPALPDLTALGKTGEDRRVPSTPATAALDRLGLPYRAHPYDHDPHAEGYGLEAARELGAPPDRVFKTLVTEADGSLAVAVVPVSAMLDTKALAAVLGVKRVTMAAASAAERRTGYVVGGISPLGQRSRLPLVLDASAATFSTIFVSGGRRGFDLELAPEDLLAATGGRSAAIAVTR